MEMNEVHTGILEKCLEWVINSPEDQQQWLKGLSEKDLMDQYFGLGLTVRNKYLWQMTPEQGKRLRATLVSDGYLDQEYLQRSMHPDNLWVPLIRWVQSQI
jgi:hypothetical protein